MCGHTTIERTPTHDYRHKEKEKEFQIEEIT